MVKGDYVVVVISAEFNVIERGAIFFDLGSFDDEVDAGGFKLIGVGFNVEFYLWWIASWPLLLLDFFDDIRYELESICSPLFECLPAVTGVVFSAPDACVHGNMYSR